MACNNIILFFSFFVLFNCTLTFAATCPYDDTTLVKFSSVSQWNIYNAQVVISSSQRIILDVSPPYKLKSIEINGELVINNAAINLDVDWIKVNSGGKFIAGSTSCKLSKKFVVTFFGNRSLANDMGSDPFDFAPLGTKGMAVLTGATLELHGQYSGNAWTRLAETSFAGSSFLFLEENNGWKVGDKLVLANTDFSGVVDTTTYPSSWSSVSWARGRKWPDQTEEVTIKSISNNGRNITLSSALNFTHWGEGFERAEVGLLNRWIVMRGDDSSVDQEFGGHLILRHANQLHIEGVEFTRFGQKGVLARYPVHFHILRDAIGKGFWIKHSSIHHNFQRCLVLHESHGILVQNMVGYQTNGHCFFLEDGGEVMNTIDRVLGINANPVANEEYKNGLKMQVIPTDNSPSIFWITNPNNTFTNNVAVGGRFGYWFLMALQVNGLARELYYKDSTYNPRAQQIGEFYNNVAHSSIDTGFEIDGFMDEYGNSQANSGGFYPTYEFFNLTAYKCRHFGIWGKSSMKFHSVKLLDNRRAFMVNGISHLHDSYIVGETNNKGLARVGHDRSYADLNGGNSTKICGHESYDNGGPQYSFNNVFENFVSTSIRKAGALCPLQTGPFMLDTENRLFNLSFKNANRFHVGAPIGKDYDGDNELGWTVMDTDGTATGYKGGGWIVGPNSSHLISPNCIYRNDWEAFYCPHFAEGYVQALIVNQDTNVRDNVLLNNTIVTEFRKGKLFRGAFYDQKNSSRFGRVFGATIDCEDGRENSCYQYMHNVIARRFYSFRFTLEQDLVKTPSYLTVNMQSAMPGDYIFVSIPYPASAQPFDITVKDTKIISVSSINNLNESTYYYSSSQELLYLRLKNTMNSFTLRGKYNFTDYSSYSNTYHVKAACTDCKPTLSKIKNISSPPSLSFKEESFTATLETCQLTKSPKPNSGSGNAFFWFYPSTRELHFNINHDLGMKATDIELGIGKLQQQNYTFTTTKIIKSPVSPARGIFVLSLQQWTDLVKGNIFVKVSSEQYPQGHLRGQILCQGTCSVPTAIPSIDACTPLGAKFHLFNDTIYKDFVLQSSSSDNSTAVISPTSICGNASILATIRKGSVSLNTRSSSKKTSISFNTYKYLEFYVNVAPENGELSLYVYLYNDSSTARSSIVKIQNSHIPSNFLLDEYSGWQRVRIPVSEFSLPKVFNLSRITIGLVDSSAFKTFYLDEIRFVAGGTESTSTVPLTDIKYFKPSLCSSV